MRLPWNDTEAKAPEAPRARDFEEVAPVEPGRLRWVARDAQAPDEAAVDPLDEVVMLKPVTGRQILRRRLYIRSYMRKYREKQRAAYFATIDQAPS
jgi:hypothetical protein